MSSTEPKAALSPRLARLVDHLAGLRAPIGDGALVDALRAADLSLADLAPFVRDAADAYSRVCIERAAGFELLCMTWSEHQSAPPHDHQGSSAALNVVVGVARETRYRACADGLVEAMESLDAPAGTTLQAEAGRIHALANVTPAGGRMVSLHVYAPPLTELRRYAERSPPHA